MRAGPRPMPSDTACRQPDRPRRGRCLQAGVRPNRTIAAMKIFSLLHVVLAQAFYRWAMREISPTHPDVPRIVRRQQELAEKYRRIWV